MRAVKDGFYKTHIAAFHEGRRKVNTCAVTGWFYKTHTAPFHQGRRKVNTRAVTGWFYKIHKYSSYSASMPPQDVHRDAYSTTYQSSYQEAWRNVSVYAVTGWFYNTHTHTRTRTRTRTHNSYRPVCRDVRVRSDRLIELLHMSRDMNYACRNRSILQNTVWSFTSFGMPSDRYWNTF